ncbi:MAG: 2OG-Fe(II) oxygenase [Pseudomonadota bacterium]
MLTAVYLKSGTVDAATFQQRFYTVAHERGRSEAALPTWADNGTGVIEFGASSGEDIRRVEIPEVPGTFQLLNVLSSRECEQFVAVTEAMGYHPDSPVSLGHDVRHNHNVNWVVDASVDEPIWARCRPHVHERIHGALPLGINARFRFYRYREGDFFKPHTDGAWPGSRVIDRALHYDAYGDRESMFTILLFLSDDYDGGSTRFYVPNPDGFPMNTQGISVSTPRGAALCFPHGSHPDHCVHAGDPITRGAKYIIRSDILYPI